MYAKVIKVIPREDFTLIVTFDNGQTKLLDVKPFINFGVFRKLKDPEEFKSIRVAYSTVEWGCGVDLDPEYIMEKSIPYVL
jgi:hypothetical protein